MVIKRIQTTSVSIVRIYKLHTSISYVQPPKAPVHNPSHADSVYASSITAAAMRAVTSVATEDEEILPAPDFVGEL